MDIDNDALFIEPDRLVPPYSWAGHVPFAAWLIAHVKPGIVVELGTHTGNSYNAACQAIKENHLPTLAFAVDTWQGDEHAGFYSNAVFQELTQYHEPRYGAFSTLLRMRFDEALGHFADGSVDLLHIDGLHTYEAVKHDFETWLPKLSERAIVLLHDTQVFAEGFGVHPLWLELTARYPGFEFKNSHGLGVLLVGARRDPFLQALAAGGGEWRYAENLFRLLGRRLEMKEGEPQRIPQAALLTEDAESLRRIIADREEWIACLQKDIADRDAQILDDMAVIGALRQALASIRDEFTQSRSWRLTRLVRVLGHLLGGLRPASP